MYTYDTPTINNVKSQNQTKVVDGSLGIAPTLDCTYFLKMDYWSPGVGFIPIVSTKEKHQIKKGKLQEKKLSFMHTKRFNNFFVNLEMGAILCWVQFQVYHCR